MCDIALDNGAVLSTSRRFDIPIRNIGSIPKMLINTSDVMSHHLKSCKTKIVQKVRRSEIVLLTI